MSRDRRLPNWLRFRRKQVAVVTALVICLLLAPWVAEAQSVGAAPVFTEGASATRSFDETLGNAAVATTDTDVGDTLNYFLDSTDAARFGIISTSGQLRTKVGEKYDHEAKSSYQVRVRVEDGSGGSDTISESLTSNPTATLPVTQQQTATCTGAIENNCNLAQDSDTTGVAVIGGGVQTTDRYIYSVNGVEGWVKPTGDKDWYKIALEGGRNYRVTLLERNAWGNLDADDAVRSPYIYGIYNSSGVKMSNTSNWLGAGPDARVYFSPQTVAAEDAGRTILVRVTFTDDVSYQETLTSDATGAVDFAVQPQRANTPATGAPTITGTAEVGGMLTAITSAIDDADGLVNASFTYQWERQDLATGAVTDIPGATGATYVVTADDRDSAIRVIVSYTDDDGNDETLSSYWLLVLTPPNNPPTGAPTISGDPQVGETLTADTSSIADADGLTNASYSYQWISNDGSSDTDITGATDFGYTVAAEDVGRTIQVRVTFIDDAHHQETLTSAATALVQPPAPDGPPDTPNQPEGTAVFIGGVDLEWNEVPGADSYDVQLGRGGQWIDLPGDGVEVAFYGAGAIISGLDPESSLWLRVRAANGHGVSDWSEMLYTGSTSQYKAGRKARPDNEPASGAPVIHGTAQVGETLWADATGIEDGNGLDRVQFQYQWTSNDGSADTDIAGATDSGYTLVSADVGRTIKVKVAFTDRGGYAESLTGMETEQVANPPVLLTPQVVNEVSGTATLTVTISGGVTFEEDQEIVLAFSGTASPDDYDVNGVHQVETATLILVAGEYSVTATLMAIDDADYCCDLMEEEEDETVIVTASHRGVTLGSATLTIRDMSHDADLKSVALPPIPGHQFVGFEPGRTTVTVGVDEQVRTVSVVAEANHPDATLSIFPEAEVQLIRGSNEIVIMVTAEDGYTTKTYTVTVNRVVGSLTGRLSFFSADHEPANHDGSSAFNVRIAFSDDVEITPEDMRDHALRARGGRVTDAAQVDGRRDLWELTVEPAGPGPVSILVQPDRACTETGALCTADGRSLTSYLALEVPGPQG